MMSNKLATKSALITSVVWIVMLIVAETVFGRETATYGILATPFIAGYALTVSFITAYILKRRGVENDALVVYSPLLLATIILPLNWI